MDIKVRNVVNAEEMEIVRDIRHRVFIVEQNVPQHVEVDQFEESAKYLLATLDGHCVGTARWRKTTKGIKLERFAVLQEKRTYGVGRALVEFILEQVRNEAVVYLHAQDHVISFYKKFGFQTIGDLFYEGGISHQVMVWKQA